MCGIPNGQKAGIEPWWLYPVLIDWSSVIACFSLSLTDDTSTISIHESCRYCGAKNNMAETTYSKSGRPRFSHEVVETPKNSTVPGAQHGHTLTRHWSSHGKLYDLRETGETTEALGIKFTLCFMLLLPELSVWIRKAFSQKCLHGGYSSKTTNLYFHLLLLNKSNIIIKKT